MLQLGIRGLGIARFKFNPISWFLKGEPGAWYDPSDLTTLFQDSAGTTPVTAVEQPVGLMLDKSKGLALGAELVTNGDFSNGTTGWGTGNGAVFTVVNNEAVVTNNGQGYGYIQKQGNLATVAGATYKFTVSYRQGTALANSVRISAISATGVDIGYFPITLSNQNITGYFTAVNTSTWFSVLNGAGTADVNYFDNISVKQIAGNHAFQATAGNRPVLSARVNLLTKTEDFSDNTAWTKDGASIAAGVLSPNGLQASQKLVENTANSNHRFYSVPFTVSLVPYTAVVYAKAGERTWMIMDAQWPTSSPVYFDLINGVVGNVAAGVTASILPAGNGWYKCSVTKTPTTTISTYFIVYTSTGNNSGLTYLGDGTSGIYIWGADLRPTNSGALLPAYQRVNTASDYDTVGFPLYLKANGTSSAMSTNSIDFTSTDKMTVVTGVRKLSDAAIGIVMELSITTNSNNGSFYVAAPISTANNLAFVSKGTIGASAVPAGYSAPITSVICGQSSISTPVVLLRVNGTQAAINSATQGIGNFGTYPLYLFSRGTPEYYLNGQFYGAIIRGAQSDTASVTQTENYMATKTGITF